jgi:ribosomal protein L18
MNCGDDECMTEKTEAKEFAYFSGLLTGRKNERERIIKLIETDIEQCETLQQGRICAICDGKREAIQLLGVKR